MGSRRRKGGLAQGRPCTGQEQQNLCTACFEKGGRHLVVGFLSKWQGNLAFTLHTPFSWCTHVSLTICCQPGSKVLRHQLCLLGILVLLLVFLACFPGLTSSSS